MRAASRLMTVAYGKDGCAKFSASGFPFKDMAHIVQITSKVEFYAVGGKRLHLPQIFPLAAYLSRSKVTYIGISKQ